jgi:hypothetical protein
MSIERQRFASQVMNRASMTSTARPIILNAPRVIHITDKFDHLTGNDVVLDQPIFHAP